MQLNLFQWDRLETGHGSACLARLDFDRARDHFARVLVGLPGHQAARAGLQAVKYWEQAFRVLTGMQGEAAVTFFWQRLREFSFGDSAVDRELRAKLPLVEQEIEPDTEAARIYDLLRRAERTRHRRDHSAMIAARRGLQALAPRVFADYLQYVRVD